MWNGIINRLNLNKSFTYNTSVLLRPCRYSAPTALDRGVGFRIFPDRTPNTETRPYPNAYGFPVDFGGQDAIIINDVIPTRCYVELTGIKIIRHAECIWTTVSFIYNSLIWKCNSGRVITSNVRHTTLKSRWILNDPTWYEWILTRIELVSKREKSKSKSQVKSQITQPCKYWWSYDEKNPNRNINRYNFRFVTCEQK